jgi:hypothetical protein
MRRPRIVLPVIALALLSVPQRAEGQALAWTSAFVESYRFDPGLDFSRVTQVTVPIGVTMPFRWGSLAFSSGYVYTELTAAAESALSDQSISGLLNTELRLSWDAVPGRLTVFAIGAIPTGVETVTQDELSVLAVVSSDIIGYANVNMANGGGVGGGFAGAVPLGRSWALGLGGTVLTAFPYTAVEGDTAELRPGTDVRVRLGVEGSLARRSYLRVAGVFLYRNNDVVGDQNLNGIGNRWVGYLSFDQGIGATSLNLYVFDVYRNKPQLEATAVGAAVLPRGNLVGAGARLDWPLGGSTLLTPRFEVRSSRTADEPDGDLEHSGESLRAGIDLRQALHANWSVVLQVDGATGFVRSEGVSPGFDGFRAALHLEWTP